MINVMTSQPPAVYEWRDWLLKPVVARVELKAVICFEHVNDEVVRCEFFVIAVSQCIVGLLEHPEHNKHTLDQWFSIRGSAKPICRVTTHLENLKKSGNFNQSGQGKVRENEKSQEKWNQVCFSSSKYSKTRFLAGATPLGELTTLPRPRSRLGRGTPHPLPQLLQPQLLNNWLSGLTLFFIHMKQRLLTISVNTRYRVIFACLYWKSQEKSGNFMWSGKWSPCIWVRLVASKGSAESNRETETMRPVDAFSGLLVCLSKFICGRGSTPNPAGELATLP